MSIRWCI